jgi:hypothetical protein
LFPLGLFLVLLVTAVEAPGYVRIVSERVPALGRARDFVRRYGAGRGTLTKVVAAVALAFVAGCLIFVAFADRSPTFAGAPTPAGPAAATNQAPLGGAMVSPSHRVLSQAQLTRLTPAGAAQSYGFIESLVGAGQDADRFPAGTTIFVHGWAGDPATKSTAAGVILIVDGSPWSDATAGYGGNRLDVARAFKTMAMFHTNVVAALPTTGLAKGLHSVKFAAISRGGRHYQIISRPRPFTLN